jgi:hypothetical protein
MAPNLVRNTTYVHPPKTPKEGYHLSEDLADDATGWLHKLSLFPWQRDDALQRAGLSRNRSSRPFI